MAKAASHPVDIAHQFYENLLPMFPRNFMKFSKRLLLRKPVDSCFSVFKIKAKQKQKTHTFTERFLFIYKKNKRRKFTKYYSQPLKNY